MFSASSLPAAASSASPIPAASEPILVEDGTHMPAWDGVDRLEAPAAVVTSSSPAAESSPPAVLPTSGVDVTRVLNFSARREQLKREYCELMDSLRRDPLLFAVWQEVKAGTAPHKSYDLGFGFHLDQYGLKARTAERSFLALDDVRRAPAQRWVPFNPILGSFTGREAAVGVLTRRLETISHDIASAYDRASAAAAQPPRLAQLRSTLIKPRAR